MSVYVPVKPPNTVESTTAPEATVTGPHEFHLIQFCAGAAITVTVILLPLYTDESSIGLALANSSIVSITFTELSHPTSLEPAG